MKEIEVKILGIDIDKVVARLEELGAKKLFAGLLSCVHFDTASRTLGGNGRLFRLRRWEGEEGFPSKFEICFKGPKEVVEGMKVREEIESTVEDGALFGTMMTRLGYEVTLDNDKRRQSFELDGFHVDIDEYPEVPPYLEIEANDKETIDRAIEQLNLDECEVSSETANELFKRLYPEIDFDHLKL